MTINAEQAQAHADALYEARASGIPIDAFTDTNPELGMLDGYEIQQRLVARLLVEGEVIHGYKLGLTSKPMQEMLGVDQPDFGPIFSSDVYADGAILQSARFIAPRIEAEIGVILNRDLKGPHCTVADVRAATAGLVAALEIVDSRIRDWKIKLADTVADLASSGAIALSARLVPIENFDPRTIGMVFSKNSQMLATGAGAAAMGDPLSTVAWLANTLAPMGVKLSAGQVIMTGALHAMVPVAPGDEFLAEFDRLGPISVKVT